MYPKKTGIDPSVKFAFPVAITGATQSLLVITLPIITALTGLKIGLISPVLGLAALAFLVGGYYWPRRAVPGRRRRLLKQLLIAATASQILFVFILYAGTVEIFGAITLASLLFITRFCYGLTVSGIYPIVQVWMVNECVNSERSRHRILTYLSATVSIVRIVVPLLAACLAIFQPVTVLLLLIGLPLLALLVLPEEITRYKNNTEISLTRSAARWPETAIAIPTLLIHMSLGLSEFIIGPYLAFEWNISLNSTLTYTALLLAVIAVCMALVQLTSLHFRPRPELILAWSPAGMACGAALAAIYPTTLPVGLILIAVSFALLLPASAAGAVINRDTRVQAHASSDLYIARILGHLLGVAFAGPLFEIAPGLPLFVAAAIALMAIPAGAELRNALIKQH
ncbi:MFS transporter [Nitrosomonas marina]|uniref:Major Facilitator Superfamily protein n=1 Tax=Nitrosomonas marina TaxID=917 RepID=A0A1H8B181_9PROT|nr:MFS transporter [Nitrosomonas marina]SEM76543.1 hypothetical protein SAMN05216325_10246 [Nitrosomonas marina]